jgi:hypothetical protein
VSPMLVSMIFNLLDRDNKFHKKWLKIESILITSSFSSNHQFSKTNKMQKREKFNELCKWDMGNFPSSIYLVQCDTRWWQMIFYIKVFLIDKSCSIISWFSGIFFHSIWKFKGNNIL